MWCSDSDKEGDLQLVKELKPELTIAENKLTSQNYGRNEKGESFMVWERKYKKMPCDVRNMASPSGSSQSN